MADPKNNGKTLWEMITQRGKDQAAPVSFRNPLDLRISSAVLIPHANGPDCEGFDFSVKEIREYVRRIGSQEFGFTDYVLRGVNTKTFNAEDEVTVRLRVMPNQAGGNDSLLLRLYDEFAFNPGFLEVVKDTTGVFQTTDEASGETERYTRINDLKDPYEAALLIVTATTSDGQAEAGQAAQGKLEYWDYWRDQEISPGHAAKRFLFVEMNSDTGWFQIWRGSEFFS